MNEIYRSVKAKAAEMPVTGLTCRASLQNIMNGSVAEAVTGTGKGNCFSKWQ